MKLEDLSNEALIEAIQRGDKEAKDVFVRRNQALVYALAKRFSSSRIPFEELVQIGCVGLMKALNHFDLSYQVKFSTYAVPIILGEIKRFFRDDGAMRISFGEGELSADAEGAGATAAEARPQGEL